MLNILQFAGQLPQKRIIQPQMSIIGINSSRLSLLYDSTLTSIHEYWKNCSFDYMDLCQQSTFKKYIQSTFKKIVTSGPITSWQIDGETMETVTDFIFLGSKLTADGDCSHEIKKCLLLERKTYDKPRVKSMIFKAMVKAFTVSEKAMAPPPVLLPGKSHGRRSLVGCGPWGR